MIQCLTFLVSESLYLNELILSANNDEEDNTAKHTSTYLPGARKYDKHFTYIIIAFNFDNIPMK